MPASEESAAARLVFSNLWQSNAKRFALCPIRKPIALDLRNSSRNHHLSLVCGACLEPTVHNRPLLLIGHCDRLKVHLSIGKEKDGSASHSL